MRHVRSSCVLQVQNNKDKERVQNLILPPNDLKVWISKQFQEKTCLTEGKAVLFPCKVWPTTPFPSRWQEDGEYSVVRRQKTV